MNFRRFIVFSLVVCAVIARAFVADIDSNGKIQHWDLLNSPDFVHTNVVNTNTHAIRFYIASDAFSTTNTAAEINAVRACFAQWQVIPGTHLKFEEAGLIGPGVDINTTDHTNVVFWVKNGNLINGGRDNMLGALGLTYTSFSSDNILVEADIVLNGNNYTWFTDITDTGNSGYFVEGTLLHEIGHFIGLHHSPVGGATMLSEGGSGSQATQAGLSSDEVSAAQWLYPAGAQLATLRGGVTNGNGDAVYIAAVMAENSAGNIVAGTVTRESGLYEIPALPPGNYQVRVTPLDPAAANQWLIKGSDISDSFANADTGFLPSAIKPTTLVAGVTNTVDFTVTNGNQAFFVSHLRTPTANPLNFGAVTAPVSIRPGQSNMTVGVYGSTLPTNGATLVISGDGISHGVVTATTNYPFGGLNSVSVVIGVASNATPGLRSFILTHTNDGAKAYANGFIEVSPLVQDYNYDGLDDLFQRKYFPLFTAAQAGPNADPDGDGYNNLAEYIAGSVPTNSASFLQIQSVTQSVSGTTITWSSEGGKKYQVLSRPQIVGSSWSTNSTVIGAGATTQYTDSPVSGAAKFYRVQAVPVP